MASKLLRSTFTVSMMTMLSRILGFIRDVVLAVTFGAGPEFDAFVIAFKIPNFMRRLFGEGAFAQAFVPVLADYQKNKPHADVKEFASRIAGTLGVALLLVVIAAEVLSPILVMIFAPGFIHDPVRFGMTQHMLRITFPYLMLISLTAFAGATLNTFGRFALPAFTPVLLNVSLITAAWFWAPHTSMPIYTLAWGVLIGGVVQLVLQFPFLRQIKMLSMPVLMWKDKGVRRVLKLMVPALFGVSVAQISLLIDNLFASYLPQGSISWLYYSDRLTYLPLGVIGVALATVVLPNLSRFHSSNNKKDYSITMDWALRLTLLTGIPSALGLLMLAGPLLVTLIHHGAFNRFDVIMTRQSLMAFAIGLPSFMLIKILASGFYSKQNIKTPVKIAATAMLANIILNLILVFPLKHAGLALATSLSALLNASLLIFFLIKQGHYKPRMEWRFWLLRLLVANGVMAIVLYFFNNPLNEWFSWDIWQTIWHLAFLIALGIFSYIIALFVLGMRIRDVRSPSFD